MSDTKKLEVWEREKGYVVPTMKADKELTEAEFDEMEHPVKLHINYPDRLEFLEKNGYEITRKNIANVELSTRPPKEPQAKIWAEPVA